METDAPVVYLTFDDGPVEELTPWVLDTLMHYGVKATFFCVGENIERNRHIYKRILEEGHQVGNHTYNHIKGWKTHTPDYLANVEKCEGLVNTKLFRPPYGRIKKSQFKNPLASTPPTRIIPAFINSPSRSARVASRSVMTLPLS